MDLTLEEALDADERGDWARRKAILTALRLAWADRPQDWDLAARLFNHLVCHYGVADTSRLSSLIFQVRDQREDDERPWVERFVVPAMGCALDMGMPNLARQLWESIPLRRQRHPSIRQLGRQQKRLALSLNSATRVVVPWEQLDTEWWKQPALLPATHQGRPLREWSALRLWGRDTNKVVTAAGTVTNVPGTVVAEAGQVRQPQDPPDYGWLRMDPAHWLELGGEDPPDEQIDHQSFYELGRYGDDPYAAELLMRHEGEQSGAPKLAWPPLDRYAHARLGGRPAALHRHK